MICHNCDHEIEYTAVCPYCGTRMLREPLPHHLPTGTVIDNRYKIMGVLGEGGFGITYLGYNQKLGMPVAIKEYFPQGTTYRDTSGNNEVYVSSESAEAFFNHGKERFLSEAKTLVRFNSEPGIVSVMDFVEENQTAYLIMEYLDGETLQQYLKRHGKMAATETFEMLEPMMRTLEKVHAAGVIHRDISPDNIMRLKNGQLKLMDFGAAREFVDENRSMSIMLKKGYAPAEQYRRKGEQGPWTDVYALCATIYRCITGVTPTDSLDRMSGEELKKPSEFGADIPPAYEGLLMYGMALHQKDRCKNMTELLGLLEKTKKAVANQPTIQIKPEPAIQITVAADPEIEKPKEQNEADSYATRYAEESSIIKQKIIEGSPKYDADQPKKKSYKGIIITVTVLILIVVISGVTIALNLPQTKDNSKDNTKETTESNNIAKVSNEFMYRLLDDGTAKILDYTGSGETVDIPSSIDGHTVSSIGNRVFSSCQSLTSVTIPDSVTSIGVSAFEDCESLTNIAIPNTVKSIGNWAFKNCSSLKSITIPNSVKSISAYAFSDCTSLKSITIPDSVTSFGDGAFDNCASLKSITIPDSVTSIGNYAFGYYSNYSKINGFTIYGKKGSAAEKYANENGIEFREI